MLEQVNEPQIAPNPAPSVCECMCEWLVLQMAPCNIVTATIVSKYKCMCTLDGQARLEELEK